MVTRALSALRGHRRARWWRSRGNHDNGAGPGRAAALGRRGRDHAARARRDQPDDHIITGVTAGGEPWRLAALPFVSQRYAVRALEMFELTAAEAQPTYADHIARLLPGWPRASPNRSTCSPRTSR